MFWFLLILTLVFVGYAVATQWTNTDSGQSIPARVWAAVVLAGSTIVAAATQWFGQ
jgi:hypothetical protein